MPGGYFPPSVLYFFHEVVFQLRRFELEGVEGRIARTDDTPYDPVYNDNKENETERDMAVQHIFMKRGNERRCERESHHPMDDPGTNRPNKYIPWFLIHCIFP